MKTRILFLLAGLLLAAGNAFAAGDLIVNGNLGVGTTTPQAKVDIVGGGLEGLNFDFQVNGRLKSNSKNGGLWVSSDRFVGGVDDNKIGFWNNGVWRIIVLNNGNVGIGDKVDPGTYKLYVAGTAYCTGLVSTGNVGIGTTAPSKKLDVAGDINFTGNLYKNGSLFSGGGGTGYSLNAADGSPTNAVYVDNDGKVGIGTITPATKLDVVGGGLEGLNFDFQVNGRLKSNSKNGGLWVSSDRFVGGVDDNKIGFWNNGVWRIIVLNNGNVGIGDKVDPGTYKLYVAGTACASAWQTSSDIRFKENFAPVESPLDKVLQMNGLSYTWRTEEYKEKGFPEGRHYGVVAQEIEKVLPEVVREDVDGIKSVSYTEIIPVLIEAIKEQQKQINKLKLRITELEK